MTWAIHQGDAVEVLQTLPDESVNCCVTSPPYWRLRDFVNMGDGYVTDAWGGGNAPAFGKGSVTYQVRLQARKKRPKPKDLKLKDMIGMPWRVAFALQDSGWYLRSDIIWHRPNPMPESVHDRCAKSHEYVFQLSKSRKYWFDIDAIKEPVTGNAHPRGDGVNPKAQRDAERAFNRRRRVMPEPRQNASFSASVTELVTMRNPRSVWTIPTQGRQEKHYASFPDELARRCVLSGCPAGGTVLDPFVGRGTTVIVALRNQRNGIGIDLSPEYCDMARKNIIDDAPLFNRQVEGTH